ncbi:MAG: hypothetical protein MJ175_09195 [Clostridia bacterium]|nr:hypothetical protein [Clostridia bacterium]
MMKAFDLSKLDAVRLGVLGDFALDIYWYADMKISQLSRETPHYPLPVVKEKISLGAAGNVASNMAALNPASVSVCGLSGDDWRGMLMKHEFAARGIDAEGLICEPGRVTNAYCKPMRCGISDVIYEDPRIDFAAQTPPAPASEKAVLAWLDKAESNLDVLCVCDQFDHGVVTALVRERLAKLSIPVIVDSRERAELFCGQNMILKPNELECRAALSRLSLAI